MALALPFLGALISMPKRSQGGARGARGARRSQEEPEVSHKGVRRRFSVLELWWGTFLPSLIGNGGPKDVELLWAAGVVATCVFVLPLFHEETQWE